MISFCLFRAICPAYTHLQCSSIFLNQFFVILDCCNVQSELQMEVASSFGKQPAEIKLLKMGNSIRAHTALSSSQTHRHSISDIHSAYRWHIQTQCHQWAHRTDGEQTKIMIHITRNNITNTNMFLYNRPGGWYVKAKSLHIVGHDNPPSLDT